MQKKYDDLQKATSMLEKKIDHDELSIKDLGRKEVAFLEKKRQEEIERQRRQQQLLE